MTNLAIFLFQIMLARTVTPADYGEAVALLGVLLIIEAPTNAVQALIGRAVNRACAKKRKELSGTTGDSGGFETFDQDVPADFAPLIGLAMAGGLVLSMALVPILLWLGGFLHLSHLPLLVALYPVPLFIGVVPRGMLVGIGSHTAVAVALVTGALVRLAVGTVLVHDGFGIPGAVAAVVIGETAGAVVVLVAARRKAASETTPLDFDWREAAGEGAAFAGFWVLVGIDLILVRHWLANDQAGFYAAATTLAQLVMILPAAAAVLLFRRLAGSARQSRRAVELLAPGLLGVAAVSAVVVVVVGLLARPLLDLVFDSYYRGATTVIWPVLLSAAVLALVMMMMQYLLARGENRLASLTWLGCAGFVVSGGLFHHSIHEIALDMLAATAATAVLLLAVTLHGLRYLHSPEPAVLQMADLVAELDLTVVVPYFNPGSLLAPNVRRLLEVLEESSLSWEVIAVSDGSTDGSPVTISEMGEGRLHHITFPDNKGKGAALRAGMAAGRGRYLGFIDADGDLDPMLLRSFVELIELHEPEIVIGSKRHPGSVVHYPPLRRVYSVGYQYLVRTLFRLNVRDTQTGLKLLRRDVLAASLPRMLEKRFAFDLELLVVARRLGFRRVIEAPIVLQHQFKSTVSTRSVVHMLIDTLAIFYRLRVVRTYDRVPGTSPRELGLVPAFVRSAAIDTGRPALAPISE